VAPNQETADDELYIDHSQLSHLNNSGELDTDVSADVLIVYPNPSRRAFTLVLDKESPVQQTVHIFNAMGMKLETIVLDAGITSYSFGEEYPAGMYFIVPDIAAEKKIKAVVKMEE
jgi:hypothetical protein